MHQVVQMGLKNRFGWVSLVDQGAGKSPMELGINVPKYKGKETYISFFFQISQHDNCGGKTLPNHPPEVMSGILHRCLSCYVHVLPFISLTKMMKRKRQQDRQ